jgi:predicted phosphohydrolase
MCCRLGLDVVEVKTWDELEWLAECYNTRTEGAFTTAARRFQRVASAGERGLLHAVLAACNYAPQADKLAGGETWELMRRLDRDHRLAVATIMARR